jgi:copper(I)-binding protein
MKRTMILGMAILVFLLAACSPAASSSTPKIEIVSPYVSAVMAMDMDMGATPTADSMGMSSMGGGNGAAYMIINNTGGAADKLLKAQSDVASSVELHQTVMKNNVMEMQPVEAIDIPANGQFELKPGEYHIMLIGLKKDLTVGEKVKINLVFEKASSISVNAEVRKP